MKKLLVSALILSTLGSTTAFAQDIQDKPSAITAVSTSTSNYEIQTGQPQARSNFLVVDGANITDNGVSWIHPSSHPYARAYITNTSRETMTVTFTHGDGSHATFTVAANSSQRFIGTNYSGTIRISFSTPSGVGSGTVSARASDVPLSQYLTHISCLITKNVHTSFQYERFSLPS